MPPSQSCEATSLHKLFPILYEVPHELVAHEVVAVQLAEHSSRDEPRSDDMACVLAHGRVPVGEAVVLGDVPPEVSKQSDIQGSLLDFTSLVCNAHSTQIAISI